MCKPPLGKINKGQHCELASNTESLIAKVLLIYFSQITNLVQILLFGISAIDSSDRCKKSQCDGWFSACRSIADILFKFQRRISCFKCCFNSYIYIYIYTLMVGISLSNEENVFYIRVLFCKHGIKPM